jgi:large subunit ribosomal protein L9
MEVILLEKISKLGNLGDTVKVTSGFGRNFLLPKGKAVSATKDNLTKFEARRAELEKQQADALGRAKALADALKALSVRILGKAGAEGKLYGSIGTHDIADAVTAAGVPIKRRQVRLPTGPLREVGEYYIDIHLHADVNAPVKIVVVREDGAAA